MSLTGFECFFKNGMGLTVFLLGYVLDAFIICVYVTKMEDWERLWGGDIWFRYRPSSDGCLFISPRNSRDFLSVKRTLAHTQKK